ncbi:porin family protein [Nordella sp. HKS 07]|uniref:outer membrane protein n=1 Tax=Nordella sp. HKS 07 TaxID=2712222 RepID=UPI0013E1D5C0|nr:outer membrane protein [Nordella sp. HKS 07]QIG51626.1 porin family protein [Nordella sp. HKS 07]
MLKNILFAGTASVLMIGSAQAADIIEPPYDWTGPYVGLQGGYGWGENDVKPDVDVLTQAPPPVLFSSIFDTDDEDVILDPSQHGQIGIDGWLGGAHAGYNWEVNSFLVGLEGDIEFADLSGQTDVFLTDGATDPIGEAKKDIDWLGSLRLRLGYAMDRSLIYLTGGLAVGGVEMKFRSDVLNDESGSDTQWGWTLGGGFEYAFTDELSGSIEYRYTDLGDTKLDIDSPGVNGDFEFENTFHAVRAGLSWHFGALY